jgi:anti-anti-sigma factor
LERQVPFRPDYSIDVEEGERPGTSTIRVYGELDSGTCESLLEAFGDALAALPERLELDLRGVTFIDSAGTRAMILLDRTARERGVELVVVPPPEDVTALLRMAGVTERVNLSPDPAASPRSKEFVERVEVQFPRDAGSPARARAEVRETLGDTLDDAQLANVVLLTSELITNAVVHPESPEEEPIVMRVTSYEDGVRVEVEDPGQGFDPAAPVVRAADGGRGLFLVDACAASWGARHEQTERGPRFRVWFELDSGAAEPATAAVE